MRQLSGRGVLAAGPGAVTDAGAGPAAGLVLRGEMVLRVAAGGGVTGGAGGLVTGWTLAEGAPGGMPADPGLPPAARAVVIDHAATDYRLPGAVAALLVAAPGTALALGGGSGFVTGRV
ncbi:MAG: hypothetical protein ACK4GT_22110, partial [Pararhodobacter sp.]